MFEIGKKLPPTAVTTPSAGRGWPRISQICTNMNHCALHADVLMRQGAVGFSSLIGLSPGFLLYLRYTHHSFQRRWASLRCRCNPAAFGQRIFN
jgi:hypothetical protein